MAISLRIPDDIKERASALAEKADSTPHAFMVEAIREKVEAEEARLAFPQCLGSGLFSCPRSMSPGVMSRFLRTTHASPFLRA